VKSIAIVTTARGVEKTTLDAAGQAEWLTRAGAAPLVPGVRPVRVLERGSSVYLMEHVRGPVLADEPNRRQVSERTRAVLDQIEVWSSLPADNDATWGSYLERLEHHAAGHTGAIRRAVDAAYDFEPFPRSWCHGDLTLENVLSDDDGAVLIDPNYSPGLYQSHILDYGKILQSTHTLFHTTISPRTGELAEAEHVTVTFLRERGLYLPALQACLTHAVRLVRHWPDRRQAVETLTAVLLAEIDDEVSA